MIGTLESERVPAIALISLTTWLVSTRSTVKTTNPVSPGGTRFSAPLSMSTPSE